MPTHRLHVFLAVLAALVVMYTRTWVVGDARWWNLVMAGLLMAVLAFYLWKERVTSR